MSRIYRSAALALVVYLGASASAAAGPLIDVLRARQTRIDAILSKKGDRELAAAERKDLGDTLAGLFDFTEMGKAALGPEWAKRSDAERKRFADTFGRLVRANSLRRVEVYQADSIDYLDEVVEGSSGTVKTTVKSKNATTEVRYDFHKSAAGYRVVDYTIDGFSAVRNYRTQFAKILQKSGFEGLLDRLAKRREEIEAGK